jgi:UDPglucose 6-dehydrogenase
MKIAVVGLWHLGEIYSICLAGLGHKIVGIDPKSDTVENLSCGKLPLPEPGLEDLLHKAQKNKNILFATDYSEIRACNVVWITFDTPVDKNDNAKLETIFESVKKMLPYINDYALLIVSSQVGLGVSEKIINFIRTKRPELKFEYAYVPENFRIGESVDGFFNPKKIVIGTDSRKTFLKICRIFKGIKTEFLFMSSSSAEMVKEATNSYLATSLAFVFDIADLCEKMGANIVDVVKALRLDQRIGKNAYLGVSIGFSGATLGRALKYLMQEGTNLGVDIPVIRAVWRKNLKRKNVVIKKLSMAINSLNNKKVAFYGLTYKGGVTTLRNSRALEVIKEIESEGSSIAIYDNNINEIELKESLKNMKYRYCKNPYEAAVGCHVLVFITPSTNLLRLNFDKLSSKVKNRAIFFDTQNFFYNKKKAISDAGFKYIGLGQ